jgi:hypothetical protein
MFEKARRSMLRSRSGRSRTALGFAMLLFLLFAGCTNASKAPLDFTGIFPAANNVPGWEIAKKIETYNQDNLFNLVDGQAESFFAYGFEQVAVQRYQNAEGTLLNAEIWQLADPADAYGLFSAGRTGTPASIGNEGDSDPGRRLAFWQNRFFVSLTALQPVPDETLQAFAGAIAARLPTGGERPDLVGRLPRSGLAGQPILFFHEEISIQMEVWLGGENILGLSQKTDGVLGHYQIGDNPIRLMLVAYPTSAGAAKGLKALQSGDIADLAASAAQGNLLGAVFGKVDPAQAQLFLQEALK